MTAEPNSEWGRELLRRFDVLEAKVGEISAKLDNSLSRQGVAEQTLFQVGKSVNDHGGELREIGFIRKLFVGAFTVAGVSLAVLFGGCFWIGFWCAGITKDVEGLRRDMDGLKVVVADIQKSQKQVVEAVDQAGRSPMVTRPNPIVVAQVVLTPKQLRPLEPPLNAKVIDFDWPLPSPIPSERARDAVVDASLAPGASDAFTDSNLQLTARLDPDGAVCRIRISTPDAMALRANFIRMGGRLPLVLNIVLPPEKQS